MRRSLLVVVLLLAACTSAEDDSPSSTVTTGPPAPSTTVAATPSTTAAGATTTTVAPTTTTPLPELQGLVYEVVAGIEFPIQIVPRNEGASLLATKGGMIFDFDPAGTMGAPILDISEIVRSQGEQGLLSIAVHPEDDTRLFIHYSAGDGDTVVEEYAIGADGSVAVEPVAQLLRLDQPARNHNGGMLQFGPDGALYLGLGDGGGAGDAFGHGQNRDTLFAGLVRIDVDDTAAEPTLFQYGLRNPWRFWIEGDIVYVADVGQGSFEEVSVAPFTADVNYGWSIMEGTHCFSPSSGCDTEGITLPVLEVEHGDAGTCSITGGLVYRGSAIPEIDGHYFYSDYCGGYLRSFRYEDGAVLDVTDWTDQVGVPGAVVSFGLDHEGEMYVLTIESVLRLTADRG